MISAIDHYQQHPRRRRTGPSADVVSNAPVCPDSGITGEAYRECQGRVGVGALVINHQYSISGALNASGQYWRMVAVDGRPTTHAAQFHLVRRKIGCSQISGEHRTGRHHIPVNFSKADLYQRRVVAVRWVDSMNRIVSPHRCLHCRWKKLGVRWFHLYHPCWEPLTLRCCIGSGGGCDRVTNSDNVLYFPSGGCFSSSTVRIYCL